MIQVTELEKESTLILLEDHSKQTEPLEDSFDINFCNDFKANCASTKVNPRELDQSEMSDSMSSPSLSSSSVSSGSLCSSRSESSVSPSSLKKLSFGQVSVHQHNVIIGDNPSCSKGPPVALDWKLVRSDSYNLDEYENMTKATRRKATRLGRQERETMLQENGFSKQDLILFTEQADQENIIRTVEKLQLHPIEEYQIMAAASVRRLRRTNKQIPNSPSSIESSKLESKRMARLPRFMKKGPKNATSSS